MNLKPRSFYHRVIGFQEISALMTPNLQEAHAKAAAHLEVWETPRKWGRCWDVPGSFVYVENTYSKHIDVYIIYVCVFMSGCTLGRYEYTYGPIDTHILYCLLLTAYCEPLRKETVIIQILLPNCLVALSCTVPVRCKLMRCCQHIWRHPAADVSALDLHNFTTWNDELPSIRTAEDERFAPTIGVSIKGVNTGFHTIQHHHEGCSPQSLFANNLSFQAILIHVFCVLKKPPRFFNLRWILHPPRGSPPTLSGGSDVPSSVRSGRGADVGISCRTPETDDHFGEFQGDIREGGKN